eukprot:GHVT01049908.1.p1 GENE.GHVT01049908.1~~GHVT01049908.1.p1  ORF type:complete len:179 (+),score=60.26 GHVT01049908.1:592-1128(+)
MPVLATETDRPISSSSSSSSSSASSSSSRSGPPHSAAPPHSASCSPEVMTHEATAHSYFSRHRISELLSDTLAMLCLEQPQNPRRFMLQQLQRRAKAGPAAGLFVGQDVTNVFLMHDLEGNGLLDQNTCRKALLSLSSSLAQLEASAASALPAEGASLEVFTRLAHGLLHLQPNDDKR